MYRLDIRVIAAALLAATWATASMAPALSAETRVAMSERIEILHNSYPDVIYSVTNNTLRLMNNAVAIVDDGRDKSHLMKRQDADIEDQLSQIYPVGSCFKGRVRDVDPGVMRNEKFFRIAYGNNLHSVRASSEAVDWFGTEISFSGQNGAARALRRVIDDLKRLPAELQSVVKVPPRTLDWGFIAETDQLDVHSFGIAIDLSDDARNSWHRSGANIGQLRRYNNATPPEVVQVFEKHGFIWGGKWYRFESSHFEYRPELIAIGNLALQRGCETAQHNSGTQRSTEPMVRR
jgi:hypothetical protein